MVGRDHPDNRFLSEALVAKRWENLLLTMILSKFQGHLSFARSTQTIQHKSLLDFCTDVAICDQIIAKALPNLISASEVLIRFMRHNEVLILHLLSVTTFE